MIVLRTFRRRSPAHRPGWQTPSVPGLSRHDDEVGDASISRYRGRRGRPLADQVCDLCSAVGTAGANGYWYPPRLACEDLGLRALALSTVRAIWYGWPGDGPWWIQFLEIESAVREEGVRPVLLRYARPSDLPTRRTINASFRDRASDCVPGESGTSAQRPAE